MTVTSAPQRKYQSAFGMRFGTTTFLVGASSAFMKLTLTRLKGRCKVGSNISILRIFSQDELRARPGPSRRLPTGGRDGGACDTRAAEDAAAARSFKLLLVCAREIS